MYSPADMERLLMIRTLRCANYSLSAILRLMNKLTLSQQVAIAATLDTPDESEEIVSVCDHLLFALSCAKADAEQMPAHIRQMQTLQTLQ